MQKRLAVAALGIVFALGACGGEGGSDGVTTVPPPTSGTQNPPPAPPPPPTTTAGCSVRERQNWVSAQLNEWYLFPETLPASPNPAGYSTVESYIDYLTATARSQGRDRHFTYLTSIKEENAYYQSGSNAGFGIRLGFDTSARRLFVTEAFEGAPGLAAGLDRGTEILAIGSSASNLRTVDAIIASEGTGGVYNALGSNTAGTTRVLRISNAGTVSTVTVTKQEYELLPVSPRYGVKILDDGGRKVGYVNLRTFIDTADPALRNAFAQFRSQGITDVIVDLRYNGGGLVRIAELMSDLMGANRSASDVLSYTAFRASKSENNETRRFQTQPQSIAPTRIAFIGTGGSASASELVINAMIPYLGDRAALVGTNTYGKPVGQIGLDRSQCDDRLRVVAFATQNRDRQGNYYSGLAGTVKASCSAADDISAPLGDPREASTARSLDFLAGRSCTPITAGTSASGRTTQGAGQSQVSLDKIELLMPDRPSTAQRETPGLF